MAAETMRLNGYSIVLPLVALAMRLASTPTAEASYLVLAVHALFGHAQVVQALGLAWLFGMLSPGVAPGMSLSGAGIYWVIGAAVLSVLARGGLRESSTRDTQTVLATLAVGGFALLHSYAFSQVPEVSILKALAWTAVTATLLAAWSALPDDARRRLETQVFGGLIAVTAVSLPLLGTEVGYFGTGFQGILSHPQGFGPTMALLGTWLAGRLLSEPQPSWRSVALLGVVLALVLFSQARTAGLALVLGVLAATLISAWLPRVPVLQRMPGLASGRIHLMIAVVGVAWLLAGTVLTDRLWAFLEKDSEAESLTEVFEISRGPLIEAMWENIEQFPLSGIGFGIASDPSSLLVERDSLTGLPVSASVEKGVMPLAVLEELGIPGLVAVAGWLYLLLTRVAGHGVVATAVFFTALILNMGEAILFSPRGMGMLVLVLVTWASTGGGESRRRSVAFA